MTQQDTSYSTQNREFIDGYELKNDGSLADRFMAGLKRHVAEQDSMTPEQHKAQKEHYDKKMAEILTSAKNYPGYNALFPNPKDIK